jgi:endoglucanase
MSHPAIFLASLLALILLTAPTIAAQPLYFTGVNLAGGDFNPQKPGVPRIYGQHFIYPNQEEVNYFASRGMNIIRFGFLWETLQPQPKQPLSKPELDRVKGVVKMITDRGMVVLLDPHNYARYYDQVIGSPQVSNDVFADFWSRLAKEFASNPRVWFGLVNEPRDMPTAQWVSAANAAIAAIRRAGAKNLILVPGNCYTGAATWFGDFYGGPNSQHMLNIKDPLDYYVIEVHQYLDEDNSGTHQDVVGPTIGSERIRLFTQWCKQHKKRAFLGEFGCAAGPIGAQAIPDLLNAMEAAPDVWLGFTWWAAGPWWGEYFATLEPKDGHDRPQLAYLKPHLRDPKTAARRLPPFRLTLTHATLDTDAFQPATRQTIPTFLVPACAVPPITAAPAPQDQTFDRWTGDTAWLADPASATTTLTMPCKDITLTATYKPRPQVAPAPRYGPSRSPGSSPRGGTGRGSGFSPPAGGGRGFQPGGGSGFAPPAPSRRSPHPPRAPAPPPAPPHP